MKHATNPYPRRPNRLVRFCARIKVMMIVRRFFIKNNSSLGANQGLSTASNSEVGTALLGEATLPKTDLRPSSFAEGGTPAVP
jgi:hypothetical protein